VRRWQEPLSGISSVSVVTNYTLHARNSLSSIRAIILSQGQCDLCEAANGWRTSPTVPSAMLSINLQVHVDSRNQKNPVLKQRNPRLSQPNSGIKTVELCDYPILKEATHRKKETGRFLDSESINIYDFVCFDFIPAVDTRRN
jgi:hypothetical protein